MAREKGIYERHKKACRSRDGGRCSCDPSFIAAVWHPTDHRMLWSDVFPTEAAAKTWRRDALYLVAHGKLRGHVSPKLEKEALDWIRRAERGEVRGRGGKPYKPVVRRVYTSDLERYVIPALGRIKVSKLRRRHVQELLVDELVSRGLSGSRIRGVLNALRAVLRRSIQADELADPTDRLDLPATERARDRVASPDEALALLEPLCEDDQELWATAFFAGLRRGELQALRDEDVDLDENVIHVRHGWDAKEGEILPKSEKGVRDVPIPGLLRKYLLRRRARTGRRGRDLVFGREADKPFTPTHVRDRALASWAAAAVGAFLRSESLPIELNPIGLHECRHTYVSLMHAAGRSLEEIGDYVGHTSTYMTDRYRHLLEGTHVEAAAALDSFVSRTLTQRLTPDL